MDELKTVIEQLCEMSNEELAAKCAAMFDHTCVAWTKDRQFNLMFLYNQERYINDILKTKGYVFLNDVYDMLSMKKTALGQLVGWVYKDACSCIEFKLIGSDNELMVVFNIDGIIIDKI